LEEKMKRTVALVLAVALMLMIPVSASAAQLAGVTVADEVSIGGEPASLAGMGIRKKFIIKVYVASLYMAEIKLSQEDIINSDQAKALRMNFVYKKVSADSLQEAWKEGFQKNTPKSSENLKVRMDKFVGLFTEDALKGDEYLMTYQPGTGTKIVLKGKEVATIPGADFASALMGIWFGNFPADSGLKRTVLGGM
jgi:hypothetical protein